MQEKQVKVEQVAVEEMAVKEQQARKTFSLAEREVTAATGAKEATAATVEESALPDMDYIFLANALEPLVVHIIQLII